MAKPFTKKVLYNLLYAVRAKSERIYIALGDGRDPADLKPNVQPGREIQHLFTYLLDNIIRDGKTTKEDLVDALSSQVVGHGQLAKKLKNDQTIIDGSVLTTDHRQYLDSFLHEAIGSYRHLALQLDVNLDPATVEQDNAFDLMLKEITENRVVTPVELAAALRSPTVGEGQLARKIEQEFGTKN